MNLTIKFDDAVTDRLKEMEISPAPQGISWPEKCGGSLKSLVIFIGPSPGGKKEINREDRDPNCVTPLWNTSYDEPLGWSRGFKVSFKPIVETIFNLEYEKAGKLIALLNMDWMQNPESSDVSYRYMWEGCSYIIPIINQCNPALLIPMDEKTFGVLQIALYENGYDISPIQIGKIKIRISDQDKKPRYHNWIKGFTATRSNNSLTVIKSFQHPARIYDEQYAYRISKGIKEAYELISRHEEININFDHAS